MTKVINMPLLQLLGINYSTFLGTVLHSNHQESWLSIFTNPFICVIFNHSWYSCTFHSQRFWKSNMTVMLQQNTHIFKMLCSCAYSTGISYHLLQVQVHYCKILTNSNSRVLLMQLIVHSASQEVPYLLWNTKVSTTVCHHSISSAKWIQTITLTTYWTNLLQWTWSTIYVML